MAKKIGLTLIVISFLMFLVVAFASISRSFKQSNQRAKMNESSAEPEYDCPVEKKIETVRGASMEPVIPDGAEISALFGYYNCNEVERNDVVLISYPGNEDPLIKFARGLPGDSYEFKLAENGYEHLLVNGEAVENANEEPYLFTAKTKAEIAKYINAYGNTIPDNRYLILGNQANGSLDATVFGLTSLSSIIAKVEID